MKWLKKYTLDFRRIITEYTLYYVGKIYFLRRTHIYNVLTNELKKCLKVFFSKVLIEDENKIVKLNPDKCNECEKCVEVCPFNAIWLNKKGEKT